ncbi:four helix bundle protein [Planctomycetota bacterium]|nr:four helix bundle protein [Planctomycetota bacterium]
MSNHKSYEKLHTWQLAMDLTEKSYRLTRDFPVEEKSGLSALIRRNIMTLPTRIAEAHHAPSTQASIVILKNAQATLLEFETTLLLCRRMKLLTNWSTRRLRKRAQHLSELIENEIDYLLPENEAAEKTHIQSKAS